MPEERIQKVLANAGVASRRASEALVAAGRVRVDGRTASIGQRVDPAAAVIEVDGVAVGVGVGRTYVALHKPAGVTSTTRDRHAETTVLDLIPTAFVPDGTRLYPVGRLDLDSEGLLFLTNDGEWAERVLHPRFGVQREYAVGVGVELTPEQQKEIAAGVRLEEGLARLAAPLRPASAGETRHLAETLDPAPDGALVWYRAVLTQGWKRQLRRMFAALGVPIVRLARVRIGSVWLGDLPSGRARALKEPEIKALAEGQAVPRTTSAPTGKRRSAKAPGGKPPGGKPPGGKPPGSKATGPKSRDAKPSQTPRARRIATP
jgi:23S rRNA pseudouridine2605 synthase